MTYRGLFCLDHLYVVMLCITFFWKVFCNNILYSLSLRLVTNTHFPDHLRTLAFQIIFWSPRYTIRLDIRHKIFANVMQNLTQDVAYFQKKNILLWFSFRRSFFVCFPSNVLMYTCFHSNWFHIETWKWCIEKDKTPEGVYLLKVTNKDTGIIESCW